MIINWGDRDDDIAVDNVIPLIIKMLSMCQKIMEINGKIEDANLSENLNLIDVQESLMDAIVSVRNYQMWREKEIKEEKR